MSDYEGITIPDDKVDGLVEDILRYAVTRVNEFLPTSEAHEGFGEAFEADLRKHIEDYSTSAVRKEAL